MKVYEHADLAKLTTMGLGGTARYVLELTDEREPEWACRFAEQHGGLPLYILGGGANTLARDGEFPGVVALNRIAGPTSFEPATGGEVLVTGFGGAVWDDFVGECVARGLTGIEAMSGIPGTLGAAPVQNIGAYGQEVAQVIDMVEAWDWREERMVKLGREEMGFGYRKSIFNAGEAGRYFIVKVTVRLKEGEMEGELYESLAAYMREHGISGREPAMIRQAVKAVRESKLLNPDEHKSAGSFFKNVYVEGTEIARLTELGVPVRETADGRGKVNTGWLVEATGFSGKLLHGVRVNPEAALVLINESAGSYADLAAAREEIAAAVFDEYGLRLEQEPVEVGAGLEEIAA